MWSLEGSQTNGSAVSNVKCCNLTADEDSHSLVIGRDNGSIEIYGY